MRGTVVHVLFKLQHLEIQQPQLHLVRVVIHDQAADHGMEQSGFSGTGGSHHIGCKKLVFEAAGHHFIVLIDCKGNDHRFSFAFGSLRKRRLEPVKILRSLLHRLHCLLDAGHKLTGQDGRAGKPLKPYPLFLILQEKSAFLVTDDADRISGFLRKFLFPFLPLAASVSTFGHGDQDDAESGAVVDNIGQFSVAGSSEHLLLPVDDQDPEGDPLLCPMLSVVLKDCQSSQFGLCFPVIVCQACSGLFQAFFIVGNRIHEAVLHGCKH